MKVTVEVKDDKFLFDYEVRKNKGHGDRDISVAGLQLFISTLSLCQKYFLAKTEEEIKEIECMAYIEKHPELMKKYKEVKK